MNYIDSNELNSALWKDFESWMNNYQGYDPKTIAMYLRNIKSFSLWIEQSGIEFIGPEVITAGLIRDYRQYLALFHQRKPSTINKALQVIRIYSRWAVEEGLIKTNQALRIQYIEEPLLAPKSLSESYVDIIRSIIQTKSLKVQTLIEVALSAGLRVSEATNLKITDLKLRKRGGEIYVRIGKGYKFRTVPIAPDLVNLLNAYIAQRRDTSEYLFTSERFQKKLSIRAVQKMVEKLRDEAGFDFTYHTFRHTYCADLLKSGMKLTDVATVAGHLKKNGMPNIATTARYVMSRQDELAKAVRKMARWRSKRISQSEEE